MAIELSSLTFTEQDDIVPVSGVEQIFNTDITNTLAGNDIINGESGNSIPGVGVSISRGGIVNTGTLNTHSGNDILTGIFNDQNPNFFLGFGIFNQGSTIDTGDGNDIITGVVQINRRGVGIYYQESNINTGNGDDVITGISLIGPGILGINSTMDTGNGDDIITGVGTIGIQNQGIINTGNGKDFLIADGGFSGTGSVFLGSGKDFLKGFGSGIFNGGSGQDTLELTPGSYTIGRFGTMVSFTKDSTMMETYDFDILKTGNLIHNFASLNHDQIIFVP